jgi:hypothetical protein
MNETTRRAALRATAALVGVGVGVAACSAPKPSSPKPAAPVDCVAITDQQLGAKDDYDPQPPPTVSSEAVQCCTAAIQKGYPEGDNPVFAKHRWGCCAVVAPDKKYSMACTPWGPPVPPRFNA